jgi:hypothetical protein
MAKINPVTQRLGQIEKEIEKIESPKNQKRPGDYKSEEGFISWQEGQREKLRELNEEMTMLYSPGEYNEIPLAIAAEELGIRLNEILEIVREDLVELSFEGKYKAGSRINREELGRLLEIGAVELLRIARQELEEIFADAVRYLHAGEIEKAQKSYDRLDWHSSCIHPLAIALETGLFYSRRDYDELKQSLRFITEMDNDADLVSTLSHLKIVIESLSPTGHLDRAIFEQILAVAEGRKAEPFEDTYSDYRITEYPSKMDEDQKRAMLISTVVMESIKKYKLKKSIMSSRWNLSRPKEEEIERVIRNAIYTALEAEKTYHDSATSKLFVDKFVELYPRRWVPAESVKLFPKTPKK